MYKNDIDSWIIINNEHNRLLDSSILCIKNVSDTCGIYRSTGGIWSTRQENKRNEVNAQLGDCLKEAKSKTGK